ncbi:MAG: prephenate dehydrogenase/arogenate dehydrogenase family protein [Pseudomonadales bacterium]
MFNRVAIIGLGLIGGSLAAGLKSRGLVKEIRAWDQNPENTARGLDLGLIDNASASMREAVAGAELVVIAVPVMAIQPTLERLHDVLSPNTIITDVGSVKGLVVEAAKNVFGEIPDILVPGHPVAGSERHGVDAADGDLFSRHKVILTPVAETSPDATLTVRAMWEALGSRVMEMDPEYHDSVLAQTSHLPHLLAYALVDTLASGSDSLEIFDYAAGGFRDFSRIAASDPVMWRDIFQANSGPVLETLDRFLNDVEKLRSLIAEGRHDELAEVFARAKKARDHFTALLEEQKK